ncbi:MAG: hypothetical protein RJA70_3233 [Pseudomonadota bacterium]|jgi:Uma2 family endonuclease
MTNLVHRRRHTFADYLDIEGRSPTVKHEYVTGEIFAMAGGSVEHSALATAFCGLLFAHLRGTPCRVHSSDLRLRIREANVATYADAVVVCDPVEHDPESSSHVTNPRVVVEVLSPSTEDYDRGEKRLYYQMLPSLREYVLVSQDKRSIEVWRRTGRDWARSSYGSDGAAGHVRLDSIDFDLDLNALYDAAGVLLD